MMKIFIVVTLSHGNDYRNSFKLFFQMRQERRAITRQAIEKMKRASAILVDGEVHKNR